MRTLTQVTWIAWFMFTGVLFQGVAHAQQSWLWARDDNSRYINPATDSISIVVLESRVPSGNTFLASDKEVGLLVDAKFTGSTADEKQASREFPLMFVETAGALKDPSHPHSKTLSNQEIIVNPFPLHKGKTVYRSVSISLTLLRKQDPKVWTKVLDTLLNVTKNVVLPSPLTVSMNYLSKFSTDVLQEYLPDPNLQKRIDFGTFSFIVSENPTQLNRVTYTGLHLRVLPPGTTGDGWVDPNRLDSYCFYTKFSGSNWTVQVSKKDPTAIDKDSDGCSKSKYTELMNDYVPILIEATQTKKPATDEDFTEFFPGTGLGSTFGTVQKYYDRARDMRKAAVAQCREFKVTNCPVR